MNINDILDSLGLDLANAEVKRGAIDAIQAILSSRQVPLSSVGGNKPKDSIDVEVDPDLLQPSNKHQSQLSTDDIEIDDEEELLKQIKHNESEDDFDTPAGNSEGDDSDVTDDTNSSESNSTSSEDDQENDVQDSNDSQTNDSQESNSDAEASSEGASGDGNKADRTADNDTDEETASANENEAEIDADNAEEGTSDDTDTDENASADSETEEGGAGSDNANLNDDTDTEADDEFDEDELLDNDFKDRYGDPDKQAKYDSRKIKRERTLTAAKKALADAIARKTSPALIKELENSIEALESLTEAKSNSLKDLSDDEFNMMINRVFDAISAVGDKDLTFTTDEERELKAKEIKADFADKKVMQELSDEDISIIRAETQAVKAREKENAIYKQKGRGSFKGFQDFLNSLYRAIALQVQTNEVTDDTWSAINRRYSGTGVLKQGQRKTELPDKKIPIIDFYFDCSGSWTSQDIAVGKKAVSTLVDMEEKGQIKINIYYFSNNVYNDMDSALNEGGTSAWNDIVRNVISTNATNVIIMTDSDMEDWWKGNEALKYTVPGYVWYLWRNGENAPRLPRDLKGRGGTQQFSFNRSDA